MLLATASFVLFLVQAAVGTPTPAASVESARALGAIEFNERVWAPQLNATGHGQFLSRRAEDTAWSATHPGLKEQIDSAVSRTASKPHFFWSGRIMPALSEDDSVMPRAMQIVVSLADSVTDENRSVM